MCWIWEELAWKNRVQTENTRLYAAFGPGFCEKLQHRIELYTPQFDQGKTMENQNGYLWLLHFWNSRFFYVFDFLLYGPIVNGYLPPPKKKMFLFRL